MDELEAELKELIIEVLLLEDVKKHFYSVRSLALFIEHQRNGAG